MNPGRELDALIAEKVMGWDYDKEGEFWRGKRAGQVAWYPQVLPNYSTDIAAAFEVVGHIMKSYRSKISIETYDGEVWSIKPCGTSSKSLPHAICLAALKAIGHDLP